MSNLRHLINYDDDEQQQDNNTNGFNNNYNTRRSTRNAFSINNLVNGPIPTNGNNNQDQSTTLPKLEYNYATPQQSSIYTAGVGGNSSILNSQLPTIQPEQQQQQQQQQQSASEDQNTPTTTTRISQEQILASFERIKTHFPAARIKKIMQSDEEIGKVAQATPIIVGRALEIFMANLVEVSVLQAKKQGVKRITASHVKSAIENTEQFDFLVEAVEKYPSLKN
ncbi:hypothetical protein I9W82_003725 [Candida metapsilosis]|uniref:Transcription factor CBF/NF-Y/archaeal histone domain-containing protein n=1 Tax=Candida metapsilosis TaxID=273372 RepID=A0A8H7ZFF8_9ASCO|nr:hypothetical protein I9W82_003725 [Candida metapsilosis]